MLNRLNISVTVSVLCSLCAGTLADCPLDHFHLGQDGGKLFVDKSLVYRHGQVPNPPGPYPYNAYYTLAWEPSQGAWGQNEPGFADMGTNGSYGLEGERNVDYQIWFEILDLAPDFYIKMSDQTWLTASGDRYNLSQWEGHHTHMFYWAYVPPSPAPNFPFWVTYRLMDELGPYENSEPFIVVFGVPAPAVETTTPLYEATLPSVCNAELTFTFHRAISVEGGPPVTITDKETHTQDYYTGYFDYEVSSNGLTLTLDQSDGTLPDRTWLAVSLTENIKDADTGTNGIPFVQYVQTMVGDLDGDGDVDLDDYSDFHGCITGPDTPQNDPECRYADFDCDGDVDLGDFAEFQKLSNT